MLIRVQRGSSTPVSRQIDAQIRSQILSGTLSLGEQLPSVRQLAGELAVNVNTVVRVYERLAADSLVEMRHGEGTFVTYKQQGGRNGDLAEERREFARDLDALVRRGLMLGFPDDLFPKLLGDSLRRVHQDDADIHSTAASGPSSTASSSASARKKGAS